jgi:hypothetical protein
MRNEFTDDREDLLDNREIPRFWPPAKPIAMSVVASDIR